MAIQNRRRRKDDRPEPEEFGPLPQYQPCPRCGSRKRALRYGDDGLVAECLACGTPLDLWPTVLQAW